MTYGSDKGASQRRATDQSSPIQLDRQFEAQQEVAQLGGEQRGAAKRAGSAEIMWACAWMPVLAVQQGVDPTTK